MNTKHIRRVLLIPIFYWLLVLLLGYLLIATCNGTGNGDGQGGHGGSDGTGMAVAGDADGGGEEDRNITGNTGMQNADSTGAKNGSDDRNESDSSAPPEEDQLPSGASEEEMLANGAGKTPTLDIDIEDITPTLKQQKEAGADRNGSGTISKVISGAEAKKGFFGVEVSGRERAFFILDISGSMGAPTAEGPSRLDMMKKIFSAELDRLHKATKNERLQSKIGSFVFATFSDNVTVYPHKGNYSYGDSKEIADAKKQVNALNIEGGTSMMNAFTQLEKQLKAFKCDMVYLLTDGEPTDCAPNQLLDWLKKNLPKQKICTFSLGTQSQLLEDIAKQHHGKHREIH